MAKYDKLIITGELRKELDAHAMSRVILLLARQMLRARTTDKDTADEQEPTAHKESS